MAFSPDVIIILVVLYAFLVGMMFERGKRS
jgi:hypothetical protein